ncbi:MAG: kinase-like domain-containing protein, partial [Olpidium bornovanus]
GSFGTVRLAEERATGVTWAIKSIKKARGSTDRLEQLAREVAVMKRVKHPHIVQLREVVETPTKIYLVMEIIMTRLLEAVAYLHDHGVVHRDLKPENVLLSTHDPGDPLYIKVSDFGLATFSGACKMMENICGTPFYMAKDLLQRMLQFDPAERITAREALQHPWTNGKEDAPISLGQTTVLQMMKSYNAERRFRAWGIVAIHVRLPFSFWLGVHAQRLFNVVMAAVRFQRGGVYGGSIDEYDSDLSEEAGLASEDETEAPTNSVSQTFTDDADEPPRVFSNDSIVCPASGPAAVNVTGSADVPLVVPPTNTNRIKRPTTATRPNHRAKIRGYVLQHGPGAGATPRGASQSPQVSSDDIQGEKPASSSGASSAASSASGPAPAAFLSIRRSLGAALAHHSPLPMRTSSSDLPTQMNHLLVSDKPVGRSRRNSTPSALTAPANNTLPRRRPSAFAKE